MKTKIAAVAVLAFAPFFSTAATADTFSSPAYVAQASWSAGSFFPLASTQDLIGPIASITQGLPALGPTENFGLVSQEGIGHVASIDQTGGRHIALIRQSGSNNFARVQQAGSGHRAFAMQSGSNNVAIISQR